MKANKEPAEKRSVLVHEIRITRGYSAKAYDTETYFRANDRVVEVDEETYQRWKKIDEEYRKYQDELEFWFRGRKR